MKIVCACLNSKYIHSSLAPWCLKAGVSAFCSSEHDTVVIEGTVNGNISSFVQNIISEKPDIIAFSCYIWNITKTMEAVKLIKEKYNVIIAVGGPEAAYNADSILKGNSCVDYVLSGEGEWTFSAFIEAMDCNNDIYTCEGISFYQDDKFISVPEKEHTETPPSPYCDEYFSSLNGRIAYIESSRGCPFRCAYCLSGRVSPLRYFDISQTKAHILKLAASGTKTIKFIDRTFNADREKANDILRFIRDNFNDSNPYGVCFHFEIAADILSEDTFELFSEMSDGLCQLEIGIQSYNESTLSYINRICNTERLDKNIKRLLSFGNMHIHTDLIAGLKGEDLESFKNSFNRAFSLRPDMLQLGFLKLLHGADMREKHEIFPCVFSDSPPYEIISNPLLSENDLKTIKNCENALDKLYNSRRFLFTVEYILSISSFSPFDFFTQLGKKLPRHELPLNKLIEDIYYFCSAFADKTILKEKLLCDIVSTKANIKLPDVLSRYSPLYKKNKKYYTEALDEKIKIVLLESCNKVYIVSENSKMLTNGRYEGSFYNLQH
ncbi:MAG: DUF4080 domain-containing protein [Clostridia bacterium]|nr:DUF4080 domain-containing protein [Clostridia bacterium]